MLSTANVEVPPSYQISTPQKSRTRKLGKNYQTGNYQNEPVGIGGRPLKSIWIIASFWLVLENKGVGSSFRLDLVIQGVVASFWLEPENTGSWRFLQVGTCKLGGWSLLPVVVGEFKEL
jgi:hypothetical protein